MIWARLHPLRRRAALWLCPELRTENHTVSSPMLTLSAAELLVLANAMSSHTGIAVSNFAVKAVNNGKLFKALNNKQGCTLRTAARVAQWFSDHWPDDLPWPADIPRPARVNSEDAA